MTDFDTENNTESRVKSSTKGLSKNALERPVDLFRSVLSDKISRGGRNVGFRARDNTIFTYNQQRLGLTYFYVKREVQADGVSTKPLDLTLEPCIRR